VESCRSSISVCPEPSGDASRSDLRGDFQKPSVYLGAEKYARSDRGFPDGPMQAGRAFIVSALSAAFLAWAREKDRNSPLS
jgi:hypothetical protein